MSNKCLCSTDEFNAYLKRLNWTVVDICFELRAQGIHIEAEELCEEFMKLGIHGPGIGKVEGFK